MATLERLRDGALHLLSSRDLVGRSRHCDVHIDARFASNEHAVLHWNGSRWAVRDLGSRNGTHVDGERVMAGADVPLEVGCAVMFGGEEEVWRLLDLAPPSVLARSLDGGATQAADDGLLALPDPDNIAATVALRQDATWVIERDGREEPVRDRTIVTLGAARWLLRLPEPSGTTQTPEGAARLATLRLGFRVSRDEEHVELTVFEGERAFDLGARAHHHPLLLLARQRLRDREDTALPSTSHGWLYQDDLARMLGLDEQRINVDVYRARKQLAKAGARDATALVERRPGTRQLRIGADHIEIASL